MPIESSINREQRLVRTTCRGNVVAEDFSYYQHGVWQDDTLYGFNELFDTRPGDFSQLHFTDLLTIARNAANIPALDPNSKFAIIIEAGGRMEELVQFYTTAKSALTSSGRTIKAFFDEESALHWLQE